MIHDGRQGQLSRVPPNAYPLGLTLVNPNRPGSAQFRVSARRTNAHQAGGARLGALKSALADAHARARSAILAGRWRFDTVIGGSELCFLRGTPQIHLGADITRNHRRTFSDSQATARVAGSPNFRGLPLGASRRQGGIASNLSIITAAIQNAAPLHTRQLRGGNLRSRTRTLDASELTARRESALRHRGTATTIIKQLTVRRRLAFSMAPRIAPTAPEHASRSSASQARRTSARTAPTRAASLASCRRSSATRAPTGALHSTTTRCCLPASIAGAFKGSSRATDEQAEHWNPGDERAVLHVE